MSKVEFAIQNRNITHHGFYCDVSTALEPFNTLDLAQYYIDHFGDSSLRYFLEQQIIADEIQKDKYA